MDEQIPMEPQVDAPKSGNGAAIAAIVISLIALAAVLVFGVLMQSSLNQVNESIEELESSMGVEVADEAEEVITKDQEEFNSFEDKYVSFEYPADVLLFSDPAYEGIYQSNLIFLTSSEENEWNPLGYEIHYPYSFEQTAIGYKRDFETFDELLAFVESGAEDVTISYETGTINGHRFLKYTTDGLGGPHTQYLIEVEFVEFGSSVGEVIYIYGNGMYLGQHPEAGEAIDQILDTLEIK